jgi:hypothetical protein
VLSFELGEDEGVKEYLSTDYADERRRAQQMRAGEFSPHLCGENRLYPF